MNKSHGYSGTPLGKKLGFKPGFRVYCDGAPSNYASLLAPIPEGVTMLKRPGNNLDLVHIFADRKRELDRKIPLMMGRIKPEGMVWVSWPKKASKVPTDITEDTVRAIALPLGLVDVKVCAVDEVWSGLKLVIRRENRAR
jgi:hypothetical protein